MKNNVTITYRNILNSLGLSKEIFEKPARDCNKGLRIT